MDPSYEDSEDDAEAMAKQMGFSSFGTQGPPKKRKFNPRIDAMVEGQDLSSLDKGGQKGQGSGGNRIPLGKPRVFGVASARNQEEIELDLDSDEVDEPACIDTSLPPPPKHDESEEDEGPTYIDTSLPPPNKEIEAAQQKIDIILANSTVPPIPLDPKAKIKPPLSETGRGGDHLLSAQPGGTELPISSKSGPTPAGSLRGSHQQRERQRNEFWYIDYYDPSFNENPWVKLEEANGLEPRGTWVERGRQTS